MSVIEYRQRPQGKVLAEYYESNERVCFIMGPIGSGKTIGSCQKMFRHMREQQVNNENVRPSRWFAVRNTYPDLFGTTIKDWLSMYGDLGHFKHGNKEPPTHRLKFNLEDGTAVEAEVVFIALDRPEHVKKLRGTQGTGFWLNEVKELNKAIVDMCDGRHGRYPSMVSGGVKPTWHGMFGDTNAPDEDHWYYTQAEEERPEGWAFLRQAGGLIRMGKGKHIKYIPNPTAENLHNLPKDYYKNTMAGKSIQWIGVNLANEYGSVMDGKPVYPSFNDVIHVAAEDIEPVKGLPLELSWDFGGTPVCVVHQIMPNGQWRIIDEIMNVRGVRQLANFVKQELARKYPGIAIDENGVGDPAGNSGVDTDNRTCFDELNDAGLPAKPASTNNFQPRWEAVDGFLTRIIDGEPALLVSPRCKVTRKGFLGGYCFQRVQVSGDERYKDVPNKSNPYSHPHDAIQYQALKLDNHVKNPIAKKRSVAPPPPRPRVYR